MNLEVLSRKVNGAGDLEATVRLLDNGVLVFEDKLNLSKAKQRDALAAEVAMRGKVTIERAQRMVLNVLQEQRTAHLEQTEAAEERPAWTRPR